MFCVFFRVVYPPLAEMTDEDKANSWKPGQKKKKSEKVDSTWNPKSKLVKKMLRRSVALLTNRTETQHLAYPCIMLTGVHVGHAQFMLRSRLCHTRVRSR